MPRTTFRDWLMHATNSMRIRAWFDFEIIPLYDRLWRWIFKVKEKEES